MYNVIRICGKLHPGQAMLHTLHNEHKIIYYNLLIYFKDNVNIILKNTVHT